MQTSLADFIRDTPDGLAADRILRACVHCGFCTATCPTYQVLGDELDGPRGRIYQIKQVLEGTPPTTTVQTHLDRCLSCRACETTCPSGVDYYHLLDIGRETVERLHPRPWKQRLQRAALRWLFASPQRIAPWLALARRLRPVLPAALRGKIPPAVSYTAKPATPRQRRMLVLDGCVQPALAPQINLAAQRLLGWLDIELLTVNPGTCCGALPLHLSDPKRARVLARQNIDAWMPHLQAGAEAVLITASGCGVQVKDYPRLLESDPEYHAKAQQIAQLARDPVEVLLEQDLTRLPLAPRAQRVAVHTPCTLQHGLGLNGKLEQVLRDLGYNLTVVAEAHLCCGSAGTYSITQPKLSQRLRERKLAALQVDHPNCIVTANIGCLGQLYDEHGVPVMHWLNLLAEDLKH